MINKLTDQHPTYHFIIFLCTHRGDNKQEVAITTICVTYSLYMLINTYEPSSLQSGGEWIYIY